MKIRELQTSDLPALQSMAEASGFPYIDPQSQQVESIIVVADDDNQPIMACAAEKLVQLFLWCRCDATPHEKLAGIRLLHEEMTKTLKAKGYSGSEAFLPTSIAQKFGRRLERSFGWIPNLPSWTRGF